jgi:hypothetical protein
MNRRKLLAGLAAMALSASACTALPAVTPSAPRTAADAADATATPAAAAPSAALAAQLPERGPAPELTNEIWLNSPPLRLADLCGQVVIVEFWTYG